MGSNYMYCVLVINGLLMQNVHCCIVYSNIISHNYSDIMWSQKMNQNSVDPDRTEVAV